MEGVQIGILIVQVVLVLLTAVAYFTIYRHRVVYAIETDVLRAPHGTPMDRFALEKDHINKRLKKGEYTILQVIQRPDGDWEIIYGQIKSKVEHN